MVHHSVAFAIVSNAALLRLIYGCIKYIIHVPLNTMSYRHLLDDQFSGFLFLHIVVVCLFALLVFCNHLNFQYRKKRCVQCGIQVFILYIACYGFSFPRQLLVFSMKPVTHFRHITLFLFNLLYLCLCEFASASAHKYVFDVRQKILLLLLY